MKHLHPFLEQNQPGAIYAYAEKLKSKVELMFPGGILTNRIARGIGMSNRRA